MICSPLGNVAVEYRKIYLDEFPIPVISPTNESLVNQIEELVESVIDNRKNDLNIEDLEHQIDKLVYELYELTDEEIEIIENSNAALN